MTKNEAMFKCQKDLWEIGPFFRTEMAQYAEQLAFEKGVEFIIEKACEWLRDQKEMIGISFTEDFIERFKKAMEE